MGSRRTVAGHRQAPGASGGTSVRRFPPGVVLFWTAALVFVLGVGALPLGNVAEASQHAVVTPKRVLAPRDIGARFKQRLRISNVKVVGPYQCGRLRPGSKWQAGSLVRPGGKVPGLPRGDKWFVSFPAQSKARLIDLRTVRGRSAGQRAALRRQLKAIQQSVLPGNRACGPLRLNLKDAKALVLGATSATRSSFSREGPGLRREMATTTGLGVLTGSGTVRPAIVSGTAAVSRVYVSPTGRTYLQLSAPVNLESASGLITKGCVLAEVNAGTGRPTCVYASPPASSPTASPSAITGVQFDANGNIYILASGPTGAVGGILRRVSPSGAVSDLITSNANVLRWLVLDSGDVIISGHTLPTGGQWTRRVSPSGSLLGLTVTMAESLAEFSDGNAYLGVSSRDCSGVARYQVGASALDADLWLGSRRGLGSPCGLTFDISTICPVSSPCGISYGRLFFGHVALPTRQDIVASGWAGSAVLMEYYPTPQLLKSTVQGIQLMTRAGSKIAIAGPNSTGQNILTLYDRATDSDVVVNPASAEIEIYHLVGASDGSEVFFDGLRFADNKYVIGKVTVATGAVTILGTTGSKLSDFVAY